jgi:hypothetical protein
MPIQLTTPIDMGALDSNPYTHIMITEFTLSPRAKMISVVTHAGYISGSAFVPGLQVQGVTVKGFRITDDTNSDPPLMYYSDMIDVAVGAVPTRKIYDAAAEELYQWLLDCAHFVGTFV